MKKSVNSNIYGYALDSMWNCYGEYLSGAYQSLVLIVSERVLGDLACNAFEKSFAKLGYGEDVCTYLVLPTVLPDQAEAGDHGEPSASGVQVGPDVKNGLGARDLFTLVEGLDPLVVVAADAYAAESLGRAYRTGFDRHHCGRLLGRRAIAFSSFEAMLDTPESKQQAWAQLKLLAR